MSNLWDQLVDCICRPPRDVYSPNDLLGGSSQTFMVGSMEATRLDFELLNKEGQKMMCSHYLPLDARAKDSKLPVVIYCHCNSGSRRDAEEAVWHLLPCGVGVVAFDFTGSGLSDGKWVTLGAHEVDDLAVVVEHLRRQGGVSSIGLWGRSMGAVTALLYSSKDPQIAGMVLDSPFSKLTDLMLEIVVSQRLPLPRVMLKLALKLMRSSVKRKAGADINAVSPLDLVGQSLIPAMFGHGQEDSFIDMQHSVKLHQAYNAEAAAAGMPVYKNLVRFRGDHNHPRPTFFYSSVCCFFHQQLKLDEVLVGGNPADAQQLLREGSINMAGEAPEHVDRANGFINTPWSMDGINQLGNLSLEQQQSAAAALAREQAAWEAGSSTPRTPGSVASGSSERLQSQPRAAADEGSRAMAGGQDLHKPSGGPDGSIFFSVDDDMPLRGQQQPWQEQSAAVTISGAARHDGSSSAAAAAPAQLGEDMFEVGSRGCLNTVPLLSAEHAELGGPLPPQPALVAALPSSNGTSNTSVGSRGGAVASPASVTAAAAGKTPPAIRTGSGSSEGGVLSPTSRLSRLLRRPCSLSSRGSLEQKGATADQSHELKPSQPAMSTKSNVESAFVKPEAWTAAGGSVGSLQPPAVAAQELLQEQPLYTVQPTIPAGGAGPAAACAAGWLSTVGSVEADSSGGSARQQMCRRPRLIDWTAAMDDRDPDLAAAIAASLQDQQQQQVVDNRANARAAAGAQDSGDAVVQQQPPPQHHLAQQQQQQQQQQQRHQAPVSAEEEADMLRKAIEMSLAEAGM